MTTPIPPHFAEQIKLVEEATAALEKEKIARAKIEFSDEYIAINEKIRALELHKASLVEHLKDKELEQHLNLVKMPLLAMMKLEGRDQVGTYKAKYKESKGVNTDKLLELVDDKRFRKLVSISQVDLKAFAREEGGDREKQLLDCIEVVDRELVDIVPIEAQR